jgi:hypothetical protein
MLQQSEHVLEEGCCGRTVAEDYDAFVEIGGGEEDCAC